MKQAKNRGGIMKELDEKNKLIIDVTKLIEWIEKNQFTKTVVTRAKIPGLNEYGCVIKYYVDYYILCERCRKCGYTPVIHGPFDEEYNQSCKGRHAWDKCFELLIATGVGFSEQEALKNAKVVLSNIPLRWANKQKLTLDSNV